VPVNGFLLFRSPRIGVWVIRRIGIQCTLEVEYASVETTYGNLAQVIVANRLTFQPVPLYHLGDWATEHGMTEVYRISPTP
jgi:hypothetical protein